MAISVTGESSLFTSALRRAALESFRRHLEEMHSPLTTDPEAIDQLLRQADSVLDDVAAAECGAGVTGQRAVRLSAEIGVSRAGHGVHPVESLRAAAVMFEVLLPVVLDRLRDRGIAEQALVSAAGALHESIVRRVGLGAVSYASFLLKKVNGSHREERRRIARELHDRAAHAVGVALQDLELHDVYADQDPVRARKRIGSARTALRVALDVVRHVAQELRESAVEIGGLEKALSDYVASRVPPGVKATISVTGGERLPDEVCDELYVVLREAIRNAVRHAQARRLEVAVEVDGDVVHATVRDDGRGFDVAAAAGSPAGIGLSSMRERLELLDGTFAITSTPGAGTTISILVAHLGSGA